MRRRLDRLLAMLDRLDELAGLNRGGPLDRRLQRTALNRVMTRFTRWLLRRPVRNGSILAAISVAINVPLAVVNDQPIALRLIPAGLWLFGVPLAARVHRRWLGARPDHPPADPGGR